MNGREIFEVIESVAATSSKNDKERLVKLYIDEPEFCKALEYAYNPFKTYGIRKRPETIGDNCDNDFDAGTWELLDDLIARRLTGAGAIEALRGELTALNKDSAELLWRIVAKDLRADFSESTCNKAKKGLIPEFPYMRCCLPKDAKLADFDWKLGVISQEKADGMFANIDHDALGFIRVTSRQGSEFPMAEFAELSNEIRERTPAGVQLHGELLVMRRGVGILAREIGNGILNSIASGGSFDDGDCPIYMIWDMIPLTAVVAKGKYDEPYVKRLAKIIEALKPKSNNCITLTAPNHHVKLIETKIFHSLAEAYCHAGELMRKGKEGTVIKNPHAIWKDGTSKEQVKLKLEFNVDLKIVAIMPGSPGTKTEGRAGAFACESSCGKLKVNVTVKNEAMRDAVDADPSDWIGRVIDVTANDIMKPSESNEFYSLFLPRMASAGYRTDKTEADDLDRILAQKEAAVLGKSLKEAA